MSDKEPEISQDEVWHQLRKEAEGISAREPLLAAYLRAKILDKQSLRASVAAILSDKLANAHIPVPELETTILDAFEADENIAQAMCEDIVAVFDRDPACKSYLDPVLFFKGFLALQTYRAAHMLLAKGCVARRFIYKTQPLKFLARIFTPLQKLAKAL